MRKFLQNYGRQVLAVASVLLMIAFVLPTGFKQMGGGSNPVIGHAGDDKIYALDSYNAKQAFDLLSRQRVDFMGRTLADILLGPVAVAQIREHPEMFPLLVKEAQRMGVTVSRDQVNEVFQNALPPQLQMDEEHADAMRAAIEQALMVQNGFRRASTVIKVSEPLRKHELATQGQGISVNLVEFDSTKFAPVVKPPTTQQIQAQYDKFKDNVRGRISPTTNPLGFGYKYPNRLKLQYIAIPHFEVRRAVEASQDAYRWDVDARKYYMLNQSKFPTTQAAEPATQKAFSLDTPRKGPTTKPFEEVKSEIKDQLINEKTEKLQAQIVEKIQSTLGADYMAYRSARGTSSSSQPTTVPASSLKVPYNTVDYLQALADQIQREFKVRPTIVSMQDRYMTPEETLKIPGLGETRFGQENLATYLDSSVAPFLSPSASRTESSVLHAYQPSSILRDSLGNTYLMRITDAQREHSPEALVEVVDQVRQDWLTEQAYAIARTQAEKLLNESKVNGLKSAAQAAGLKVITTGTFLNQPDDPRGIIPGYVLSGPAKTQFLKETFKLLSTPPAHPGAQPVRVVELPQIAKVDVAELANVTPLWSPDTTHLIAERAAGRAAAEQVDQLMRDWFSYDGVVSRLKYKPVEGAEKEHQPPAPPEPPIF